MIVDRLQLLMPVDMIIAARAELAALRAENAAQAKQIETLQGAIRDVSDWLQMAHESMSPSDLMDVIGKAEEAIEQVALSSLPPSDMRRVPAKRLERLEDVLVRFFAMPGSPIGEGWAAETLGVDIITLNIRAAEMRKSGHAIVPVEGLREIERLRAILDMLRVQAAPEIIPGWVGIPETEWSGALMLLDHDGLLSSSPTARSAMQCGDDQGG